MTIPGAEFWGLFDSMLERKKYEAVYLKVSLWMNDFFRLAQSIDSCNCIHVVILFSFIHSNTLV